jgi:hypothetical protein
MTIAQNGTTTNGGTIEIIGTDTGADAGDTIIIYEYYGDVAQGGSAPGGAETMAAAHPLAVTLAALRHSRPRRRFRYRHEQPA